MASLKCKTQAVVRRGFQLCLPEDRLEIPFNLDTTSIVLQAGTIDSHNISTDTDRKTAKEIRCFTTTGTPQAGSLTLTVY